MANQLLLVAVTDFLKPPRISEVDCSAYKGHAGDKIMVFAIDDFKVKKVSVKICDPAGTEIESATCQPDVSGQKLAVYRHDGNCNAHRNGGYCKGNG